MVCCANKAPVLPIPDKCRLLIIPPDDPFYSQYGVTCVAGRRLISTRTLGCGAKPVLMVGLMILSRHTNIPVADIRARAVVKWVVAMLLNKQSRRLSRQQVTCY